MMYYAFRSFTLQLQILTKILMMKLRMNRRNAFVGCGVAVEDRPQGNCEQQFVSRIVIVTLFQLEGLLAISKCQYICQYNSKGLSRGF